MEKKGYGREKILKNNHSDILRGIEKDFWTFLYNFYWFCILRGGDIFFWGKEKKEKKIFKFLTARFFSVQEYCFCNSLLWKRSETKLGQVETILAFDRCRSQLFPHDLFRRVIRQFEIINTRHNAGQVIVGINIGWVECFLNNC